MYQKVTYRKYAVKVAHLYAAHLYMLSTYSLFNFFTDLCLQQSLSLPPSIHKAHRPAGQFRGRWRKSRFAEALRDKSGAGGFSCHTALSPPPSACACILEITGALNLDKFIPISSTLANLFGQFPHFFFRGFLTAHCSEENRQHFYDFLI